MEILITDPYVMARQIRELQQVVTMLAARVADLENRVQ